MPPNGGSKAAREERLRDPDRERGGKPEVGGADEQPSPDWDRVVIAALGRRAYLPPSPTLHAAEDQDQEEDRARVEDRQRDQPRESDEPDRRAQRRHRPAAVERHHRQQV